MSEPTFLFVCVHNAGRSVMAEAFCNALAAGRARGVSAGTQPGGSPHPEVVEAMAEVGIDVSAHRGVLLDDAMVRSAARVFTMGCAVDSDVCPAILYADTEDWGLPDPKGKPMDEVRAIRHEVRRRVESLLTGL
ncbi:MAG TPA: arsenate reductase ArsC [Actinomycetota bacterium]